MPLPISIDVSVLMILDRTRRSDESAGAQRFDYCAAGLGREGADQNGSAIAPFQMTT